MPSSSWIANNLRVKSCTTRGARPSESSSTSNSSGRHINARSDRQHLPLAAGEESGNAAAQFGQAREEVIDQLFAELCVPPRRRRATGAARFSATVRFGKTFSRSGTSTMPRAGDFVRRTVRRSAARRNVIEPSVTRASSIPRNPEIARNVVVLPAPLVPSRATICFAPTESVMPCTAVIARVIDDLELVDLEQERVGHLRAPATRPVLERPQQEIILHAPPDADQTERLEHAETRSSPRRTRRS